MSLLRNLVAGFWRYFLSAKRRRLMTLLVALVLANGLFLLYANTSREVLARSQSDVQRRIDRRANILLLASRVLLPQEHLSDCKPRARRRIGDHHFQTPSNTPCKEDGTDIRVLYVIYSSRRAERQRNAVRMALQKQARLQNNFEYIFVVERSSNRSADHPTLREGASYGDVLFTSSHAQVESDVIIRALPWVMQCCKRVQYIVEVSDNVFVNTIRINTWLKEIPENSVAFGKLAGHNQNSALSETGIPLASIVRLPKQIKNGLTQDYPKDAFAIVLSKDIAERLVAMDTATLWNIMGNPFRYEDRPEIILKGHPLIGVTNTGRNLTVCELQGVMTTIANTDYIMGMYGIKLGVWVKYTECHENEENLLGSRTQVAQNFQEDVTFAERFRMDFVINHPSWCESVFAESAKPRIVAVVISAHANFEARQTIRETWGNRAKSNRVKTIFLLGRGSDDMSAKISEENDSNNDIIVADFVDDYYNLTLKTFAMMLWANRYCASADYVIKIDDDVFMNSDLLVSVLDESPRTKFYFGDPYVGTRPVRDIWNKWYTPEEAWDDQVYPPYHAGFAYVISSDVISDICNFKNPSNFILPWEDAMTGILISQLDDVTPVPDKRMDVHKIFRHPCSVQDTLLVHHMGPLDLRKYWYILHDRNSCGRHKRKYISLQSSKPKINTKFAENSKYLVNTNETDLFHCKPDTFLVTFVFSDALNYERRKFARLTWAKYPYVENKTVQTAFVIGRTEKTSLRKFVLNEMNREGDIVLVNADINDDDGISGKLQLRILKEIHQLLCPNVPYVMKVEDDVFVNLVRTVGFLKRSAPSKVIFGRHGLSTSVSNANTPSGHFKLDSFKKTFIAPSEVLVKLFKEALSEEQRVASEFHDGIVTLSNCAEYRQDICYLHNLLAMTCFEGSFMIAIARMYYNESFFLDCNISNGQSLLETHRTYKLTEKVADVHILFNNWLYERRVDVYDYKYLIAHRYHCYDSKTLKTADVFLLILILTKPEEFERRSVIRSTWLKQAQNECCRNENIAHLFVVGEAEHVHVNEKLREEDDANGDILQISILDNFRNGTLKTISTIKWISQHCLHAMYVLRTKSSTYVNLPRLVEYLVKLGRKPRDLMIGYIRTDNKPVRHVDSIFYTPQELYPAEVYPRYLEGGSYVMSSQVVHKLYLESRETPVFPWEDVYVGMLLQNAGLQPHGHSDFSTHSPSPSMNPCQLKTFISWKVESLEHMGEFARVLDRRVVCSKSRPIDLGDGAFFLQNHNICNVATIDLLIVIMSKVDNVEKRKAIRETWAMSNDYDSLTMNRVKHVFIVARAKSGQQNDDKILAEADYNRDVIVLDFLDDYESLTSKTVMALKWSSAYCRQAKYLLKADDDVFVNTVNLLDFLQNAPRENFYMGHTWYNMKPVRSKRDVNYTPYSMWSEKVYPAYNAGPSYVLSSDVIARAYTESRNTTYLNNEDVYVGLILQNIGVFPTHDDRFIVNYDDTDDAESGIVSKLFSVHSINAKTNYKFWYHVYNSGKMTLDHFLHPHNRTVIESNHVNFRVCEQEKVDLIIFVFSGRQRVEYRQAIRNTWGRPRDKVKVVFIVGQYDDKLEMENFEKQTRFSDEQNLYADTFNLADIVTSRHKNGKLLDLSKWVRVHCPHAQYFMVTNDNTYVEVSNVLEYLNKNRVDLMGRIQDKVQLNQSPTKETKILSFWLHQDIFIVNSEVAMRIEQKLSAAQTDLLPASLLQELNIHLIDSKGFDNDAYFRSTWSCKSRSLFVSNYFTPQQIYRQYAIERDMNDCPREDESVPDVAMITLVLIAGLLALLKIFQYVKRIIAN